jgi:hypothetical protein
MWSHGTIAACVIMAAELGTAVMYALDGDWRRCVVWVCYTIATIAITM